MMHASRPFAPLAAGLLLVATAPALAASLPTTGGAAEALVARAPDGGPSIGLVGRLGPDEGGGAVRLSSETSIAGGLVLYAEAAVRSGERDGIATLESVGFETVTHRGAGAFLPLATRLRASRLYLHAAFHGASDEVTDRLIVGERAAVGKVESSAQTLSLAAAGGVGSGRATWFGSVGVARVTERVDITVDGPNDVGTTRVSKDEGIVPTLVAGLAVGRGRWAAHAALEHVDETALVLGLRFGF